MAAREQDVMVCSLLADDAGEIKKDVFPLRGELRLWAQDEKPEGRYLGRH